ncbi:MAG: 8-oxo-dGTP diphosphatase [Actinomycetota bacterium]|nr:8-oxo-dGTP diphosphatase [Actinomycetota bacterium]
MPGVTNRVMTGTLLEDLASAAQRDGIAQLVVGAVVVHDDRVLLLRRPADDFMGGIYELPSGKVDPGESLDAALAREVTEETGLTVEHLDTYLGAFDYTFGSGRPSRQFTFAVTVAAPKPVILTEHNDHRWHPLDEEPPVTDAVQQILANYQRG